MQLTLTRDYRDSSCTLGYIAANGKKWASIEPPWLPENGPCGKKGISCIPAGAYRLHSHSTEAHKSVWALVNPTLWVYHWDADVPKPQAGIAQTMALLHIGNWAVELGNGIALGKERAKDRGIWMVRQSADAVNELRMAMAGQFDNTIIVVDAMRVAA